MADLLFSLASVLMFLAVSAEDDHETKYVKAYDPDGLSAALTERPHFVMFYAPWCGHCKHLAPTFDLLAKEFNVDESMQRVIIAKVDCTQHTPFCIDSGVKGYPTLIFFYNGLHSSKELSGNRDLENMESFVVDNLEMARLTAMDPNSPERKSRVHILTSETFEDHVAVGHHFVDFYTSSCVACDMLVPVWEQLARVHEKLGWLKVAKMDCSLPESRSTCEKYDITGYPSLFFFSDGKKTNHHTGQMDLRTLKIYVAQMKAYYDMDLQKSLEDVQQNLKEIIEDKEFLKVQVPEPKEDMETTVDDEMNDEGLIYELTTETFNNFIATESHFVNFYDSTCLHCKTFAPTWRQIAVELEKRNDIVFNKVDCKQHRQLCMDELVFKYPSLVFYRHGKRLDVYDGPYEQDYIMMFALEMARSSSDEMTRQQQKMSSVVALSQENLQEVIKTGHVFFDFYKPWCQYSKALAPIWEQVGEKFSGVKDITIAKMDCSVADYECGRFEITGYPSMIMFVRGEQQPLYTGAHNFATISSYIMFFLEKDGHTYVTSGLKKDHYEL